MASAANADPNEQICNLSAEAGASGDTRYRHYTADEMEEFQLMFVACLLNIFAFLHIYEPFKSVYQFNGKLCQNGKRFLVGAQLPSGQVIFCAKRSQWDLFTVPVVPRAPQFDGHTPATAIVRLKYAAEDFNKMLRLTMHPFSIFWMVAMSWFALGYYFNWFGCMAMSVLIFWPLLYHPTAFLCKQTVA